LDANEPAMSPVLPPRQPLRCIQLARPFNRLIGTIPKSVLEVPSMMSVPERRFLYGVAKDYYLGEGVIVDAGIFLGASTRCFGEGLRKNPAFGAIAAKWRRPIVSFERGIVNPTMPAFFARNRVEVTAAPGESFADAVRGNVEPVADLAELRIGDIMETGRVEAPIEILFLDVLKMPEIAKFVVETYYAKLIPGRSIVIQQDYFYELLPYIKVYQEALADYFAFIGEIGSTAVFLCTKQIPQEATVDLERNLDPDDQLRLSSIALQRSHDPSRRFLMALSKLRLIRKLHGLKAAQHYLQFVKSEYPEQLELQNFARLREALRGAEQVCRPKKDAEADAAADEI
jgi:hypothetical protein